MSINVRGSSSKKESLQNILTEINARYVFIQETHLYGRNKLNLSGYSVFFKNRSKVGSKGGIATCVQEPWSDSCVLIHESKKCEFIAVKVCCTSPNLCLLNYYGKQENTTAAHEIIEDLSEVFGVFKRLSEEGNAVVLGGDFNCSLGNSVLKDNHEHVSKAGRFVNNLIETNDDLGLLNVLHDGSCVTHIDASGGRGKCLDLVIANKVAGSCTIDFLVDEERLISPYRYLPKTQSRVYTDHLTLCWEMNLATGDPLASKKKVTLWNRSNKLGDGKFAYHLDRSSNKIIALLNKDNVSIDEVLEKVNKEQENARHRGYKKISLDPKQWEKIEDDRIAAYKWEQVQKAIDRVKEDKKNKTIPLRVFAMRKSKLMAQRGDMVSSLKDPDTGRIVETRAEVYRATVRHNEIVLSQYDDQPEAFKKLTEFKMMYVDWAKEQESIDPKDDTIYLEEYMSTMRELVDRNKSVYQEMKKWGPRFRVVVYWLMRKIYETEQIPSEFNRTELQALYKNKGERSDLSNYRFLHLKTCLSKLFEAIVMNKVKADLWGGYASAQIGGKPNSRTSEHLYRINTMFLSFEKDKESEDGAILILKDVVKAFDRLSAKQTLTSTAQAGVKGKNLRILDKLNRETTYRVVGDPEETEFVKEYVGGQGTGYMAPAASLTMPEPMNALIEEWEEENNESLGVRVGPASHNIVVNECEFVDDQFAVCRDARAARVKGELITLAMDQLNVRAHPVKTRFMVVGKPEYVEEMEKALEEEPIMIQGFEVEKSDRERYLGMILSAGGSRATVTEQMEFRIKECDGKVAEILNLMNDPAMRGIGYLAGLKVLFDSIMTSTAIYSAATWLNMTKAMYEKFDKEMKRILYTLLKICRSTTLLHVCWELDIIPWSYQILKEKINFVSFLCHSSEGEAARMARSEARRDWRPGLIAEVRRVCQQWQLPDPSETPLSKETVTERMKEIARQDMYESITRGHHLNMEFDKVKNFPSYIYEDGLSVHQQKILFCYRLGILGFKKRFSQNYSNVNCVHARCPGPDSLEHSFNCAWNPVERPKNRKNLTEMLRYLEKLHLHRISLVNIPLYWM